MISGVGANSNSQGQAVSSDLNGSTSGMANGELAKGTVTDKATDPQFGDLWKDFQSKLGAKPEKPREIKKTLGKDDFLRIMITQMKNQDPTSPFKADEMAQQMATYASVEQLQNINSGIGKLGNANQPLERLAMTNMIGKVVTIDRERFQHEELKNESLQISLPRDAANVRLVVADMKNNVVIDKDIGAMKKGDNVYVWDGLQPNRLPAKGGQYQYKIVATDASQKPIPTDPKIRTPIIGISFEGAEPVFLVGDAKNPQKITLQNISKIETTTESGLIPGARPLVGGAQAAAPAEVEQAQPEVTKLPPRQPYAQMGVPMEMQQERQVGQAQIQAAMDQAMAGRPVKPEEKGFPSGLSGSSQSNGNSSNNPQSQPASANIQKGGEE